jgi:hypothetical protein
VSKTKAREVALVFPVVEPTSLMGVVAVALRRFSLAQGSEVKRRYQEGESLGSLGRAFGVAVSTIALILERSGIQKCPARAPKVRWLFTPTQEKEIGERYAAGESAPNLVGGYGVDTYSVFRCG